MSFNSKQYLLHEERRLQPDDVLIKGTRRRYHEISKELVLQKPDTRTEEQLEQQEDEYLKQHGIT